MPHHKCRNCMHEWVGKLNSKCDWCEGISRVLEKETPFEKYAKDRTSDKFFGENIRETIRILKGKNID